jgi:hypothetical protein
VGASGKAVATLRASINSKDELRAGTLALRVVATQAGKGTAFEKKGGPKSRPVMKGKPFDVEDDSRWHMRFHNPPYGWFSAPVNAPV